ncbi:hypothetical protein HMPREF9440_01118 [Sutterella parvirubra YIT 11816]|uniref:Uncharacterized protein n=1 Tax=Sutterella parvirubra YIT 11816 TaxID=762967 RepID=H3KEF4_9BURK|nr:hypothetical protein HMPREF9440_01118 [Sutterella parvirubra YIT 11816]
MRSVSANGEVDSSGTQFATDVAEVLRRFLRTGTASSGEEA